MNQNTRIELARKTATSIISELWRISSGLTLGVAGSAILLFISEVIAFLLFVPYIESFAANPTTQTLLPETFSFLGSETGLSSSPWSLLLLIAAAISIRQLLAFRLRGYRAILSAEAGSKQREVLWENYAVNSPSLNTPAENGRLQYLFGVGAEELSMVAGLALGLVSSGLLVFGYTLFLLYLTPLATTLTIVAICLLIWGLKRLRYKLIAQANSYDGAFIALSERLSETLSVIKVARAEGTIAQISRRLVSSIERLKQQSTATARASNRFDGTYQAFAIIILSLALYITLSNFEASLSFTLLVIALLGRVFWEVGTILKTGRALAELTDVQTRFAEHEHTARKRSVTPVHTISIDETPELVLRLKNLTFSFDGQSRPLLNDLSLDVMRGEFIGITGPSGCGKTTLLDLATCLLPATTGKICAGPTLCASDNTNNWRQNLSYITQGSQPGGQTVRDAICWGTENVKESELYEALGVVGLPWLATKTGLAQEIDGKTRRLSGGEKQRLLLVRALLRKPALIVVDEALSGIDDFTLKRIMGELKKRRPELAIVAATHSSALLSMVDRVFRIDHGKLVCSSEHQKLAYTG